MLVHAEACYGAVLLYLQSLTVEKVTKNNTYGTQSIETNPVKFRGAYLSYPCDGIPKRNVEIHIPTYMVHTCGVYLYAEGREDCREFD